MTMQDKRVLSAAKYWATRPGNWTLSVIFDIEDAQQEAALALLEHERKAREQGMEPTKLTWSALYCDVQDAARKAVPGYRQRKMFAHIAVQETDDMVQPDNAPRLTLLAERIKILKSLSEQEIAMIEGWLAVEEDKVVGARYGVKGPAWCWRRKRLFDKLAKRGL
jgi:hypothetical protein